MNDSNSSMGFSRYARLGWFTSCCFTLLVTYEDFLKFIKLHALHYTRLYLDALLFNLCLFKFKMFASLFWILPVFRFFLVIFETPSCLLLLTKNPRLLGVFRLLTICVKMSIASGHPLLL